jgi:hypothetical protein
MHLPIGGIRCVDEAPFDGNILFDIESTDCGSLWLECPPQFVESLRGFLRPLIPECPNNGYPQRCGKDIK